MIFPVPQDLKSYQSHPLTWMVICLNILLFVMIFAGPKSPESSPSLLGSESLRTGGRLYQQYLAQLSLNDRSQYPDWIYQLKTEVSEQSETLGAMAIRDEKFLKNSQEMEFDGDPIAISLWRKNLAEYLTSRQETAIFKFGLSAANNSITRWITYQFSHSSWFHLVSNLMYLIVFSFVLEGAIGGVGYLLVYLLGGFAGAFYFNWLNPSSAMPMVGASASVSALISFYVVLNWGKNTRFFDFFSFVRGRAPWIYLPTAMIIPLYLLVDLSQLLSMPEGLGSSVAYSAHLGGTLMGIILGFLNKILTKQVRLLY